MSNDEQELKYLKRSADPASQEMLKLAEEKGYDTIWDRLEKQPPRCKFGSSGICCRNCMLGPCRITPRTTQGICGATEDTIVARNVIRSIAAGSAGHSDHGRPLALTLKSIAEGHTNEYHVADANKLKAIAHRLNIPDSDDITILAAKVAEVALNDFGKQDSEPLNFLKAYAPKKQKARWQKLEKDLYQLTGKKTGVLPRSIDREVVDTLHRTHMGTDHDPVSLLMQGVRTSLADGWGGSLIATELQDVVFGTPSQVKGMSNLGVIEPDYVNIIVHGHEPILSAKVVEVSQTEEMQTMAKKAGAKGLNVIGLCCTGNELLMRQGVPIAGNMQQQELAIMTGAIEAFVVDVQCIYPALTTLAQCFHTKFISTSEQAAFPGGMHIQFDEDHATEVAQKIIATAVDAYKVRDKEKVHIPSHKTEAIIGFSVEEIIKTLGGSLDPLIAALKSGEIKGIVSIMGCNTPFVKHDAFHIELTKALLKKNILVIGTGCCGIAAAKAGFMQIEAQSLAGDKLKAFCEQWKIPPVFHMGSCVDCSRVLVLASMLAEKLDVEISSLPIIGSAPEWMSEKAFAIGTYFVSSGIPMHLWPMPPVAGSEAIVKILTQDIQGLFGAYFFVEENPVTTADKM